ncbi:hypothetical protein ACIGXM_03725 [Kitasatospora sp. NPDC052896]|uniref:hypothetical protein n=1 Tax=Kitasatospora sp. NPDC052896 TaxID=3364061 RepID=UPI0037C96F03
MSTTPDLITAAVLFGPETVIAGAIAWTWRGSRSDSAAVCQVLADSAAERAATQATDGGGTPPGDREPAPEPAPAPVMRLATVTDLTTRRRAA